jgi:hypothetical protein
MPGKHAGCSRNFLNAGLVPDTDLSEADYLRQVELLARDIADRALDEGWLRYAPDPDDATPLQRAVNAMARQLRHYHFEDDGCADPDAPFIALSGALLVVPSSALSGQDYADICARLGVPARPEGWALWHSRDGRGRRITMVTSKLAATEGMLLAWSKGRDVMPVRPVAAAIVATVSGWLGSAVRSPGYAAWAGIAEQDGVS